MSNSFFVFLPSNVTDYPDNQPNKFRVRLPKSLHFNGSWVCGLHSISYPYSWSTIGTLDEQWIDIHFTDIGVPEEDQHRVIRVPVPRSSQNRVEQLRDFLATTLRSHVNAKLKPLPREEEADQPVTPPPASRPRVDESEKSPKSSPEPVTPPASPPRVDDPEEPPKSPPAYVPPTKSVTASQTPKLESPPPAQTPPALQLNLRHPYHSPTPPLLPKPSAPPPASTPPKPSSTLPPPPTPTAPKSSAPPTAPTPPKPSAPPPALTSPKPASPPTPVPTPPKPASPPPRIPTPPKPASPLPPVPTPPKPTSPPPPVPTPKPASPPVPTPKAASPQKPPKTKLAPPPPPAQTQPSPVKTTPASKILTAKTIPKAPPRQKTPPPPEIPTRPSISPTLESPPRIDESNRTIVKPSVKESTPPRLAKTFDTTSKEVKPTEPVAAALTQLADLPVNTFSIRINPLPLVPNSVSIQYLDDVERFKVSFNDRLIRHLSFSPQLGYVLGFENPQHVVSNEVAKYPVDLRGGISSFAVYSKGLTENMIVGNSLSSLLRVVSVSGATPNDYNEKIYDSPIFARVLPREINEIEIELRTMDKGRLVPFAYGTTLVVLLFKKVINF
ncbi:hypothetical protein niasHT_029127 [Heterodera trifolii]|uniref:Uncharacterized protein n=1 Tax=Heterodera trifolii TaxID=157864 RepID=A0ABD2K1T2_9BILA